MTEARDFEMTLNELLKVFPCFTIEDWRLCTYKMINEEYGPYFERLKLAQFVDRFGQYEKQRQPIVETIRENERKDAETAQTELMRYIQPEYATAKEPTVRDRVNAVDWFKGENRLTYTERQEMDKRQKQSK